MLCPLMGDLGGTPVLCRLKAAAVLSSFSPCYGIITSVILHMSSHAFGNVNLHERGGHRLHVDHYGGLQSSRLEEHLPIHNQYTAQTHLSFGTRQGVRGVWGLMTSEGGFAQMRS